MMDASPVRIPIEGVIDLHTFSPGDAGVLLDEYLPLCAEKGITEVKVIHGKGTGVLKAYVLKHLSGMELVAGTADAAAWDGGWGATIVHLKRCR